MNELTNEKLIMEWMDLLEHNKNRSIGTINKYHPYITGLAEWLSARGKNLIQADIDDLQAYTGIEAHKRKIAPRSRRPLIAAIRGFYRWAASQWYVKDDPAKNLEYPACGDRLPRGMTLKNANLLLMQPGLDEFIDVRDTAIIGLFIGCGLRLSGLVALNQEDLIVTEIDDKERMIVRVLEKGDKDRLVPVPDDAALLLRAYLGHPDLKAIDRTIEDGRQVLFVSMNNTTVPAHEYFGEKTRLTDSSVYRMIRRRGERAGIPPDQCHPHALRHLYGTELTESDVQQRKIQVLLGHASPKSTALYQHVAMRTLMQAVDSANPLAKMHTPVTELKKHLAR